MLRLIGLVVSIGLADSLNPGTIAPAMYLATGTHAPRRVAAFTLGVFAVYLVGGILIALGPGQLLLSLVPKPDAEDRHVVEIVIGATLVIVAGVLWYHRGRLAESALPDMSKRRRSSALLGATITAVELPTAFPYFAAIAAIVGSGLGTPRQLVLLVIFNICFIVPLLALTVTLSVAGDRAEPWLARGRDFLERRWPVVLAVLLCVAGVFVVLLGVTGLAGHGHSRFGRLMRGFHRIIHP